jgi:hypothetical protein
MRIVVMILMLASGSAAAKACEPDATGCPATPALQCRADFATCSMRANARAEEEQERMYTDALSVCFLVCAVDELVRQLDALPKTRRFVWRVAAQRALWVQPARSEMDRRKST